MKHMTLEQFINSDLRNQYIRYASTNGTIFLTYVRKSQRYINGVIHKKVLDRANTSVFNPTKKQYTLMTNVPLGQSAMLGTGSYRELDSFMFEMAKKYGFDGVFIESVLNEHLLEVLPRYGYSLVENSNPPCFWKGVQ